MDHITKGKTIDQTSPKKTGKSLADSFGSLDVDYSHGRQDKIDYSDRNIQSTVSKQIKLCPQASNAMQSLLIKRSLNAIIRVGIFP